jgi:hypothetical protein
VIEKLAKQYKELGAQWTGQLQCLFADIRHRFGHGQRQQRA